MSSPILSNRVVALAIVALTLAGVASLVGTQENEGALSSATQALAEKAAQSSGQSDPPQSEPQGPQTPTPSPDSAVPAAAANPAAAFDFAEEESLIDDASGFDPSPISDDPAEGEVVAIIENEASAVSPEPVVIEEP